MYSMHDPKWVKAETVRYSDGSYKYVDVTAYGQVFRHCLIEWSNSMLDKTKSDVLVQHNDGNWLRVWFYDNDLK